MPDPKVCQTGEFCLIIHTNLNDMQLCNNLIELLIITQGILLYLLDCHEIYK